MKINQDKFYKSQGFLWSIEIQFESIIKSVNEHDIDGPYCLNCCSDLVIAQNTSVRNKRTSTSDPMP